MSERRRGVLASFANEAFIAGKSVGTWISAVLMLITVTLWLVTHRSTLLLCALAVALLYIVALHRRIHALTQQLKSARASPTANPKWLVEVRQDEPWPVSLDSSEESVEQWLDIERASLLRPMRTAQEEERSEELSRNSGGKLSSTFSYLDIMKQLKESTFSVLEDEKRTYEEFEREVDQYVTACRSETAAAAYARAAVVEMKRAEIQLRLHNCTSSNVTGVQLELTIPDFAFVYEEAPWDAVSLPTHPRPWGPVNRLAGVFGAAGSIPARSHARTLLSHQRMPRVLSQPDHTTRVVFAPEDLRAESDARLQPLSILASADSLAAHQSLVVDWRLTAASHDHALTGQVAIVFAAPMSIAAAIRAFEQAHEGGPAKSPGSSVRE